MALEPLQEPVHATVDPIPVPESVRCHSQVLNPGFGTRLVAETELARVLFRGAEEVRNTFGVLGFLLHQQLLELVNITTIGRLVALVCDKVFSKGCHWLDKPGQDLIQVFVRLWGGRERGGGGV